MNKAIKKRDKIFDCFLQTNLLFDNLEKSKREEKSRRYFIEIFQISGVDYNNPDEAGLEHVIKILNSRALLEGSETSKIIKNMACLENYEEKE